MPRETHWIDEPLRSGASSVILVMGHGDEAHFLARARTMQTMSGHRIRANVWTLRGIAQADFFVTELQLAKAWAERQIMELGPPHERPTVGELKRYRRKRLMEMTA